MTTAFCSMVPRPQIAGLGARTWGVAFWRALVYCSLFSIIFLPEFARDGSSSGVAFSPYAKAAGGFRIIDLAILFLLLGHLIGIGCLRWKFVRFPRALLLPGLAFLACLGIALCYGSSRGGSNFFFDWRALALGVGLYFVWSFWLQTAFDVAAAMRLFGIYMTARIGLLYVLYAAGYRDQFLDVSIPIFDGPILSCIVFTALLAFSSQEIANSPIGRLFWCGLALAAYFMVLVCLRRTYWAELALGTLILLLLQRRNRLRNLVLLAAIVAIAAGILGGSFSGRLQSLDVTGADNGFSADNADHLNDLMDAWYQVRQSPVMGIGLGTSYSTWRIRNWKAESVMVHNAPLHVWLKYGIAGLAAYLWFHVALLRWLYDRSKAPASGNHAFLVAAFAYLTSQFVVRLGFAPWPYSELQLTVLISFILAAAVVADQPALWSNL